MRYKHYFFLTAEEDDDFPGLSVVIVPPPNGLVLLLEPSERFVIVPEPNFCVVPVTVFPLLSRSVVIVPPPNGLVVPLEPSERFVIVPEPNFCVVPVRGPDGGSAANEQVAADRIAKGTASDVSIPDIVRLVRTVFFLPLNIGVMPPKSMLPYFQYSTRIAFQHAFPG